MPNGRLGSSPDARSPAVARALVAAWIALWIVGCGAFTQDTAVIGSLERIDGLITDLDVEAGLLWICDIDGDHRRVQMEPARPPGISTEHLLEHSEDRLAIAVYVQRGEGGALSAVIIEDSDRVGETCS